jgi:hypothetical protein
MVGSKDASSHNLFPLFQSRVEAGSLTLPILGMNRTKGGGKSGERRECQDSLFLDLCPQRRRRELVVVAQSASEAQVARTPSQKTRWCCENGATTISFDTVATATPLRISRKPISLAGPKP